MAFIRHISNNNIADQELVERYRQTGDLQVLALLFERYLDLLYGVCLKYLKEPETAKDAVMQLFEYLVEKLRNHEVSNFKSWLHTVAKNHCLMQLRTPKNLKTTELRADHMQSEEELHLNGVMKEEAGFVQLEKCLETLPAEQKMTVQLFYLQNKCYKEIAQITGLEWNEVRSCIQNGRRNLKLCMERTMIRDLS